MPHPELHNHTRLAHAIVPLLDEAGAPMVVALLQGSFALGAHGSVRRLAEQPAIELGGLPWDDGAEGDWRLEPQIAFTKPGCDVVLNGHAVPSQRGTTTMLVEIAVATLRQRALVFGPRRMLNARRITAPDALGRIPLRHHLAFGGWDRREADPATHSVEARNPLGRGYRDTRQPLDRDFEMPAIENPEQLFERYGDTPAPVGFGFVAAHWQPRAAHAGTYDAAWLRSRMPLLPLDFDRRFFLAASPRLSSLVPLSGGEAVSVIGTTPSGRLDFSLPQLGSPLFHAHLRGWRRQTLRLSLDTVVIDTDDMRLAMTWRGHIALRNGPHDLLAGEFHLPDPRARHVIAEATGAVSTAAR